MLCEEYNICIVYNHVISYLFLTYNLLFRVSTAQLHNPPPYQSRHQSLQSHFTDDNSCFNGNVNARYQSRRHSSIEKKRRKSSDSTSTMDSSSNSSYGSDEETESMISQSIDGAKSDSLSESEKSDYSSTDGEDNEESLFV